MPENQSLVIGIWGGELKAHQFPRGICAEGGKGSFPGIWGLGFGISEANSQQQIALMNIYSNRFDNIYYISLLPNI